MNKFNYKKRYGQNFLIDNGVLEKIVSLVQPTKDDLIIEIGAGSGNLTKKLQGFESKIISYEIDLDIKPNLEQLANENTEIIFADFLDRDISADIRDIKYKNLYVIANLPYYITTPIIEKIIKAGLKPYKMILMVQKEMAERLSALPKTKAYGYITVYLNYRFQIKKVFNVSKKAFFPSPNVESAVIEFTADDKYKLKNEEIFIKLIKDAFKQKRKVLSNNLNSYDKAMIEKILIKHNYSLRSRAEEIPVEVFVEIANAL